jgi:hypothetical protein
VSKIRRPAPKAHVASEIVAVRDDQVGALIDQTSTELTTLLAEAQELSSELSSDPGTALVALTDRSPKQVKLEMATLRSTVMRKQQEIKIKQEELRELLQRKMNEVSQIMAPMQAMVKRLEEGIWTANLYLGRDEEIIPIRDGAPADQSTPITVRQLVLAMDEECSVAAEEGGIDAMSIDAFDEWLLADDKHLSQVFPEQRGVVALVPRWSMKDYGNPWESMARNKDNHQTYFLIRNGERLYRYVTDFNAGERLVPTASEFTDFFYERGFMGAERKPIAPGSSAWDRAETEADARKRHYMRVGLILQGLIDRTAVFQPLPGQVRFLEADDYDEGRIVIIADGDLLLSDGREPFREWQSRLMAEVRPGMRIIGAFNTYGSKDDWAIHPRYASHPESLVPHSITERVGGNSLKFTYDRTDEVWGYEPVPGRPGYERMASRKPKTRASCTFSCGTELVLPFDLIDIADIDRFLRSRVERHRYVQMFPLLKAARRTLIAEAKEEAPFRAMLTGVLARDHNVEVEDVAEAVPSLVAWWKTTNRNHRPLVGSQEDNAKAVRLISAEYGHRLADQRHPINEKLVATLRAAHADALIIARRRDGTYVVLDAQDDGDTFVTETIYSARGVQKTQQEWQLVGTSTARWAIAYTSDAFATWNTMAERRNTFSGPEIEDAVARLIAKRRENDAVVVAVMMKDGTRGKRFRATSLTSLEIKDVNHKRPTDEYWADAAAHPLTGDYREPSVVSYHVQLQRVDGRVTWERNYYGDNYPTSQTWPCWEPTGQYSVGWRRMWLDDDVAATANLAHEKYREVRHHASELGQVVHSLESSITTQYNERAEKRAYDAFIEEYHDPELWEGHRKSLRIRELECGLRDFDDVQRALQFMVEGGHVLNGLSVREVADRALTFYGVETEIPNELDDFVFSDAR